MTKAFSVECGPLALDGGVHASYLSPTGAHTSETSSLSAALCVCVCHGLVSLRGVVSQEMSSELYCSSDSSL